MKTTAITEQLKKKIKELEENNSALKMQIEYLESEKQELESLLQQEIKSTCPSLNDGDIAKKILNILHKLQEPRRVTVLKQVNANVYENFRLHEEKLKNALMFYSNCADSLQEDFSKLSSDKIAFNPFK